MRKGQVRLKNLRPEPRDITLTDGTNLRLGPRTRENDRHISAPIYKRLLHMSAIMGMVHRREIKLIEEE